MQTNVFVVILLRIVSSKKNLWCHRPQNQNLVNWMFRTGSNLATNGGGGTSLLSSSNYRAIETVQMPVHVLLYVVNLLSSYFCCVPGVAVAQRQSVRLSTGRLGVRSTATSELPLRCLGMSAHLNRADRKQISGFSLQLIFVPKSN